MGLENLQITKFHPRVLSDDPISTLAEEDAKLTDREVASERHRQQTAKSVLSSFEPVMDNEHTRGNITQEMKMWEMANSVIHSMGKGDKDADGSDVEETSSFVTGVQKFHEITSYGGDIREFACLFSKLQISTSRLPAYARFLGKMLTEFDPEVFNIRDPRCENKTLLHAVCSFRDLRTAQFLLDFGADINAVDVGGRTPLMQTFLEPFAFIRLPGYPVPESPSEISPQMVIDVAQFLIRNGAKFDFGINGDPHYSLLHCLEGMPMHHNKPELIKFLVQHGHPVDTYASPSGTPLVFAAVFGHVDSVRLLLRLGANPNVKLTVPKSFGELHPELEAVIQWIYPTPLVEHIANVCLESSRSENFLEIFRLLLEYGAIVHPRKGQVGLHNAQPMAHACILYDRTDILRILLRYHPGFVFSENAGGSTPLFTAVYAGNVEAAQLLIDHGADVNARSLDGLVPFLLCFADDKEPLRQEQIQGRLQIACILEDNGADVAAYRCWQFGRPQRVYWDRATKHGRISTPHSAADDAFINEWRMWAIRRK